MSTSDRVRAILGGTIQSYRTDPTYRQRADLHSELEWIGWRLNQPIRIALAGTLKAGKSTLVNALVGDNIAPTDATEATRIVTWFRHGPTPKVTANHRRGRRTNVPIARDPGDRGGLTFDFGQLIAHAAKTRTLEAGTVVGSGTVANRDAAVGCSCIAERRVRETIESGKAFTPFMKFGDRIRIEMFDALGKSIFGATDQKVVRYTPPG